MGDFIKKIGEIFKESEKLYETEGLPSPNAIGTLQTNGKVTSLQKVLKL